MKSDKCLIATIMYEFQLFYEQIDLAVFKDKSTILSSGERKKRERRDNRVVGLMC